MSNNFRFEVGEITDLWNCCNIHGYFNNIDTRRASNILFFFYVYFRLENSIEIPVMHTGVMIRLLVGQCEYSMF